jgi:hypothetical protein
MQQLGQPLLGGSVPVKGHQIFALQGEERYFFSIYPTVWKYKVSLALLRKSIREASCNFCNIVQFVNSPKLLV